MADDGMLLNFELPTDAFQAPKKAFKGGSWKDRLTARKSAQWGRMKAEERATGKTPDYGNARGQKEEYIRTDGQPSKRPRTDKHDEGFKPARTGPRPGGRAPSEREVLPKSATGEVISSLFTYNPAAKAPRPAAAPEDDTPVAPSNAPLTDELATFTNLGLSARLAGHLMNKLEIKAPTGIQRKSLQELCKTDNDAFIQAETGSGKTLAYLLPIVQRICDISKQMKAEGRNFDRKSGLFALILAPTRELSRQIETVLEGLLSCCNWIVGGTVIGGEGKQSEKARLRKGVNILVATPGRLADHLHNTEVLDVSRVRWLVLDEGDRLMELGFDQDIQKIVSNLNLRSRKAQEIEIPGLPEKRNTVLCSATIKADIEQLKSIALHDPVTIAVDASERVEGVDGTIPDQAFSAPAQLKQSYAIVPPKQRLVTLVAALKQAFKRKGSVMKCIVFISCADSVDFHFEILSHDIAAKEKKTSDKDDPKEELRMPKQARTDKIPQGNTIPETRTHGPAAAFSTQENPIQIFRLHGSLQQSTRTAALKAFSKCTDAAVLVCTDVASRGLDLPNVDLVIEYDPPFSKEDHLHRVGRTARAGKEGRAMIFLQPGCEEGYVEILKEGRPRNLTHHDADELLKKGFSATSGVVNNREWEQAATEWQIECERWTTEHPRHLEQARRAYQSHIRAYTTHVAAERGIFDMKQLHLGHLAKAFALRDKPGAIRVPGLRPGKEDGAKMRQARRVEAGKASARNSEGKRSHAEADLDVPEMTDEQEARKKMHAMGRKMGGASEFNLG